MSILYAFVKYFGGCIFRLIFRQKTVGRENIPKDGGYILCCNHTHFLDVGFLVVTLRRQIHFMAKAELFKNPICRWFFNRMGAFPVARGTGTGGAEAIKTATQVVNSGKVMGIFPEGTRSPDGKPHKAKSGVAMIAASTGARIVPVSIYYEGKLKLFKKVTVRIGEPISAEEIRMADSSRAEIRRVSTLIMDRITSQWQEGHVK